MTSTSSPTRSTRTSASDSASAIRAGPRPATSGMPSPPAIFGGDEIATRSTSPSSKARVDAGAALDEEVRHAARGEPGEQVPQVHAARAAPAAEELDLPSEVPRARGVGDDRGRGGALPEQVQVSRERQIRVEDDADGIPAAAARQARREARIVRAGGAAPDEHGVDAVAQPVDPAARRLARHPARVAGARRDAAVERHRGLERHVRAPLGDEREPVGVELVARVAQDAGDHLDPSLAQARDAPPVHERVGVEPTTTRRTPASMTATEHGGAPEVIAGLQRRV